LNLYIFSVIIVLKQEKILRKKNWLNLNTWRENESIKTEKLHLYADLLKIKEVIFCLGFFFHSSFSNFN
jgi:hypothetical protein